MAGLVFFLYWKFIRGTQSERAVNGVIVLIPVIVCFYILKLSIFIKIFELFSPAIFLGLVVLFAPEIRQLLSHLGREGFGWFSVWNWMHSSQSQEGEPTTIREIVKEVIDAVEIFAQNKVGSLIVFDPTWSDKLYINSGRKLDAIISTELLLNIFYPKSPLHDGAVLIRNKRIVAASVILPIAENPKLNPWQYGTRHRAALGISEYNPTAICLIVSEETGRMSLAENGRINKISSLKELSTLLEIKLLSLDN